MWSIGGKPASHAHEEKHQGDDKDQQVGPREVTRDGEPHENKEVSKKCRDGEHEANQKRPVEAS
jgi:hypothetical protein